MAIFVERSYKTPTQTRLFIFIGCKIVKFKQILRQMNCQNSKENELFHSFFELTHDRFNKLFGF